MFISTLILPFLLATTPVTAGKQSSLCPKSAATPDQAAFRRLGDLPPAEAFKAVWRSSDCSVGPILARDRLGSVPRPRR